MNENEVKRNHHLYKLNHSVELARSSIFIEGQTTFRLILLSCIEEEEEEEEAK